MVSPEARSNKAIFQAGMKRFRKEVGPSMDAALLRVGQIWNRAMQKRIKSGSNPPGVRKPKNQPTGTKTGQLARSLFVEVAGKGEILDGKKLRFGSRMPGRLNYSKIQNSAAS